jgi:hypothetical protein
MTRVTIVWLAAAAWAVVPAAANGAAPSVEAVRPAGGQRGNTFTLTLTGAQLAQPSELLFYTPGVTCSKLTADSENEVTAVLHASADCRLGEHAFRLRTPGGASELRTLRVTPFPVVAEREPNNSPKQAQRVDRNVTVTGIVENGDRDCFALELKKGERLSAEVEAIRAGGELFDAVLTVFGPDDKELVTVDDTPLFRQDPFASLLAPADGIYTIQVRETNYGGGENSRYLLHVGTYPRPVAVFPPGGPGGTEVAVRFLGDAAGDFERTIKLPATAEGQWFELYPDDGKSAAPSPMPFRVSPFPNVLEAEPNDTPRQANPSPAGWPIAFNGVIGKPGDVDCFTIRAAKGDEVEVEAFAYRLGSPLDTVVSVLTSSGESIAANDDDETHDSRVRFTAPAAGEYVLRITDKRGRGGPDFLYRLEVQRPQPNLRLFLAGPVRQSQIGQVVAVPRGNRVAVPLGVRRSGCDGDVAIRPGELPRGVRLHAEPIPAGRYYTPAVFEAAADAPLGGTLLELKGSTAGPRGSLTGGFVQVVDLVGGPADALYHGLTVTRLCVVVIEDAPFTLSVEKPAAPLVRDGTLDLRVRARRAAGFNAPIMVSLPFLPSWAQSPATVTIPEGRSEVVVRLDARPEAEPGEWGLVVQGRAARVGRQGRLTEEGPAVSSELFRLRMAVPDAAGAFTPAAGEQGKAARVVCKLPAKRPRAGLMRATLEGLPARITAAAVDVPAGATEVAFTLDLGATAPVGRHKALACRLSGEIGGQKASYVAVRGGDFTIGPPGRVMTDPTGRLLSPLEVLRQMEGRPTKPAGDRPPRR